MGHPISRRTFLKTAALSTTGLMVGRFPALQAPLTPERWACSSDLNIVLYSPTEPPMTLTRGYLDFKPSWSPDGRMLTFFRAEKLGNEFKDWRSKICVINVDGTGFRELTSAEYPNFNPTWTRDGSNRIVFNRLSPGGDSRNQVFWVLPTGAVGDEELISDPEFLGYEWVNSGLRDGRLFVDRIDGSTFRSFLLTPGDGTYEEIERPTPAFWHKLSVSPSETKVAYMLERDDDIPSYNDSVICYAEFDVDGLRIHNQVQVTADEPVNIQEYPAWNRDESLLVYDSNEGGRAYQVYAYQLEDRTTTLLSPSARHSDQFADFERLPK